jgi:ribosomal protein S25
MTHRRQQVLSEIADAVAQGESVTRSALARRCGLYSYREASRIMRDLKKMGALI